MDHLPDVRSIKIQNLTDSHTRLVIPASKLRDVTSKAAPERIGQRSLADSENVNIGQVKAMAMAISFSGKLTWELHIANEEPRSAFSLHQDAGCQFDMKPFKLEAIEAMRIEKAYRHWKADLITEYNPFDSAIDRFVKLDKDVVGKEALLTMLNDEPWKRFVSMTIDGDEEAPAQAGDSIFASNRVVGTVTSAAWGHSVGQNLAMGYIVPQFSKIGTSIGVEVLADVLDATICSAGLYNPDNKRAAAK